MRRSKVGAALRPAGSAGPLVAAAASLAVLLALAACGGSSDEPPDGPYMYVSSIRLGYDHDVSLGDSSLMARICASDDSGESAIGAEIAASAHGPGLVSLERAAEYVEDDGCATLRWKINQLGEYTVKVERVWMDRLEYYAGANTTSSDSIEVTDAPGPILVDD